MTPKTKKVSAALGSAVVLASGAYALGTQTGDGSASADKSSAAAANRFDNHDHRGGPVGGRRAGRGVGLRDLASRLKVDPAKLRQALKEIRVERRADGGPAKELASALGLPEQQVRDALDKLHAQHRGDRRDGFLAAVAKFLGLPEAKVRAALDKLGPARGHRRDRRPGDHRPGARRERLSAAAKELGVSESKLRSALHAARPDFGPGARRGRGPAGLFAADLAKALGVSAEKVEAALARLRASHDQRRAEFVKKLAGKLGIPESRVKAALPDGPMGMGPPRGHRGPPGGPPPGGRGPGPGFGPPPGGGPPPGP